MNKLGIHCQRMTDRLIGIIGDWPPPLIVWVDPDLVGLAKIRAASPGTFVVGRKYEEGTWHTTDLKARAYQWADACEAMGHCDAYLVWNEPFGHDSSHEFAPFDEFQMWFRERMLEHGMEAVGLNVGTGNFTKDGPSISGSFPDTCRTFPLLGIHEYSWPSMRHGVGYYCGRWPYWLEDIGREDVKLLVTECGMTQAVVAGRPDEGWRSGADGVTDQDYLDSLSWYNSQLVQDARVVGAAIFNFEGHGWATFEHADVPHIWQAISGMDAPVPPEPNGGEDVVIPERVRIYDFEHGPGDAETRDQAWLESIFGKSIDVHPVTEIHQPQQGDIVYQLEWINCKAGSVSCIIEVKDVNGDPVIGETVIFGWPDADPHGYSDKGWNWTSNGAAGDTEAPDGHVGPALSTGSYYSPDQGEKGPHFIWIWDRLSEMVDGVGMLASHHLVPGANHLHTEYGYRAVRWGDAPPPPPPPDGDLLEAVRDIRAYAADGVSLLADIKAILLESPPPPPPPPPPPEPEVFHGQYFNNTTLSGEPALVRDDAVINFNWGLGSPGPGVNADNFSVRWTGNFTFEPGAYRFKARADDGVRLWVDGALIIDAWKDQGPTTYEATVTVAGLCPIRLEYYERGGGAVIGLIWDKVG